MSFRIEHKLDYGNREVFVRFVEHTRTEHRHIIYYHEYIFGLPKPGTN